MVINLLQMILIFTIGLMVGSFLNVVIYRLPEGESIVFPPSHCPDCNHKLKFHDLIPVISFLSLSGKCRYCGSKISWQYPLVELITGILYLLLYLQYGYSTKILILMLLISALIVISLIDLKYKIIPNIISYSFIIIGLILALFFNHISILNSVFGIVIPAGLLLILALLYKKGMGMGDVKLVAMIGAFIGWKYTLLGIFFGSLFGSVIGLVMIGSGIIDRKSRIPFAPFIGFGTLISILYGQVIVDFYLSLFI